MSDFEIGEFGENSAYCDGIIALYTVTKDDIESKGNEVYWIIIVEPSALMSTI